MSDFARKQLEKYGWTQGKGLGKQENGIVNPIKTKLKFDTHGIGHNSVKQLTSAWWYDMFNDASKRISVKSNDAGIHISSQKRAVESVLPTTALIHKTFIKAEPIQQFEELPSIKERAEENSTSIISDAFFRNCEGTKKTCFNYSLTKAKIKRIKRQEAIFEKKYQEKKKSKSKKKKKHKKMKYPD